MRDAGVMIEALDKPRQIAATRCFNQRFPHAALRSLRASHFGVASASIRSSSRQNSSHGCTPGSCRVTLMAPQRAHSRSVLYWKRTASPQR
jgi:hypothetical protein